MTSESADNNPMVSLAKQSNTSHSLLSQRFSTNFWFIAHDISNYEQRSINNRASDHMTGSLKILSNYEPCDQGIIVFMADGTTSLAQGRGTTYIAGLTLNSILYVLDLRCNPLSVSKITKERNCTVPFFHSHCVSGHILREDDWQS